MEAELEEELRPEVERLFEVKKTLHEMGKATKRGVCECVRKQPIQI